MLFTLLENQKSEKKKENKEKMENKKAPIIITPAVEPPSSKRTRYTNQLKFLSTTVMRLLAAHEYSWPFSKPINPKEIRISDYYETIETPMDFSSIRSRFKNRYYWSAKEAIADFNLIFENAFKISKPNDLLYIYAESLKEEFLKMLEEMPLQEREITEVVFETTGRVTKAKPRKIAKRRQTLPPNITDNGKRNCGNSESDEKEGDEKETIPPKNSAFLGNVNGRLNNLRSSLELFHNTFIGQLRELRAEVADDVSDKDTTSTQRPNEGSKKAEGKAFMIFF